KRAHPSLGERLQEAPDSPRRMAISGHRREGPMKRLRNAGPPARCRMTRRVGGVLPSGAALVMACLFGAAPIWAADSHKVLRYVFSAAETGFDPAGAQDLYSGTIEQAIFETLLTYDYLARPAKLVPQTAEAMPQVSDDGKTYVFKIKKGIHFTSDPVFKGKKRELTAEDYVYSLKRLVDPRIRSPWAWLLEGKIVGLDEL